MITLVTGGCRSGKSSHALGLALSQTGPKIFIATAKADDDEMRLRVEKHRKERGNDTWTTIEESIDLNSAISKLGTDSVVLIDCVTIWISNLMYDYHLRDSKITEEDVCEHVRQVLTACKQSGCEILFVTNEVGLGVAPANDVARLYRDLVGRANQIIAAEANEVYLMISSIPMKIK